MSEHLWVAGFGLLFVMGCAVVAFLALVYVAVAVLVAELRGAR